MEFNENKNSEIASSDDLIEQTDSASNKTIKIWKFWLWFSVIFMVLCSSFQHFLFDWTGCPFFALWCPICESPAEHTKLMLYPSIFWWLITFFAFRKKMNLDLKKWIFALCISAFLSVALLTCFYWVFFYGLNLPMYLVLHIMFEALAFAIAQVAGLHAYKHSKPKTWVLIVALGFVVIIALLMAVFSYLPPNANIFVSVPY